MPALKIAAIDDDPQMLEVLEMVLQTSNTDYKVETFTSGHAGIKAVNNEEYVAVLVDLNLVNLSGKSVIKQMRHQGIEIPIIVITADESSSSTVECLEAGADDYITKPFENDILLARLHAALRRYQLISEPGQVLYKIGEVEINVEKIQVTRQNKTIDLTPKEYKLIEYLVQNPGKVISREKLLSEVWGYESLVQTRVVDVHIANLRKKLNTGFDEDVQLVKTVRGFGYRILTS